MKEKYINFSSQKRGKTRRRWRKGVLIATFVLTVGVISAAVYAVKANATKTPPSASSTKAGASASPQKNSSSLAQTSSTKPGGKTTTKIPVLMYHSINFDPKNPQNILRVPKDKFAAEMKWLHDNEYTTLSLDELYNAVSNNKPVAEKSVVLTFDDGYGDNYDNALPVIKQYGFKATVFMISSKVGDSKNGYLTAAQIKEMDKNGMHIECHTVHHPDLSTLSYNQQYNELSKSKADLEALLGRPVDYIAYPSGKYNSSSIKAAKAIGYKLCFKMNGGIASISSSRYEFPRAFVGEDLQDFKNRVKGTADYSK
jgi:peptidoglycan/xylan/chitin deacetylase (PgdA/CDA1 family)